MIPPLSAMNAGAATALLATVRAPMDPFAREIFDLWFNGRATPEVILATPAWANYMRASTRLRQQVDEQLRKFAEEIRRELDLQGQVRKPFTIQFHAELGSHAGGYFTGYDVLHGSHPDVGDFILSGQVSALLTGPPGSSYTASFQGLSFAFNDIVDANKHWNSDVWLKRKADSAALALNGRLPRDYIVRIKWSDTAPINIVTRALVPVQTAPSLRTFQNR